MSDLQHSHSGYHGDKKLINSIERLIKLELYLNEYIARTRHLRVFGVGC